MFRDLEDEMSTQNIDASTAVSGYDDIVTTGSHKAAMTAQWNNALELAADIVEQCGHISSDLARQRILARKWGLT